MNNDVMKTTTRREPVKSLRADHGNMHDHDAPLFCFVQDNLYDPDGGGWTGTHLQNFQVARALLDAGLRVAVVVVTSARPDRQIPAVYDGIDVRRVVVGDRMPFVAGVGRLRSVLGDLHPTFIYTRGRSWLTGAATMHAGSSDAVAIWATNGEDSCERWKFMRRALRAWRNPARLAIRLAAGFAEDLLYARGIRRADLVINQTATQRASLQREFRRDGVVIHSIQEVPAGPFVKHEPPVVLWIGQLVAEKRPAIFLDLVERCADLDVDFRLIGKMSPTAGIDARLGSLRDNPRFHYLGALTRRDVHEQLEQASLMVNTSTPSGDGVPNAMIEAWMRNVPALSLEIDPDGLIRQHGAGIVCDGDVDRLIASARLLLGNRQELARMGEVARNVALEEFSAERNAARYMRVLQELLVSRGRTVQLGERN